MFKMLLIIKLQDIFVANVITKITLKATYVYGLISKKFY